MKAKFTYCKVSNGLVTLNCQLNPSNMSLPLSFLALFSLKIFLFIIYRSITTYLFYEFEIWVVVGRDAEVSE